VKRLDPEIGFELRVDTALNGLQAVRADAARNAGRPHLIQGRRQFLVLSVVDEVVGDAALDIDGVSAVVDGAGDAGGEAVAEGAVRDPLNPAAALLPVGVDHAVGDGIREDRVDAVLLGDFQGVEDPPIVVVGLDERVDVEQVAAVRPAADQVAAAEKPAHREVLDLAAGKLGRLGRGLGGARAEGQRGAGRKRNRALQETAAVRLERLHGIFPP